MYKLINMHAVNVPSMNWMARIRLTFFTRRLSALLSCPMSSKYVCMYAYLKSHFDPSTGYIIGHN